MAKSRYIGDYPVIGIRPVVDGRRGPTKLRENYYKVTGKHPGYKHYNKER